jgi:regulator of nonsense transcripts 1
MFLLSINTSLIYFFEDRLPIPLGEFASENVYDGKLRSKHKIADYSCIAFIDVWKGEETKQGSSWLVSRPSR